MTRSILRTSLSLALLLQMGGASAMNPQGTAFPAPLPAPAPSSQPALTPNIAFGASSSLAPTVVAPSPTGVTSSSLAPATVTRNESVTLQAGEVFEILAVPPTPTSTASWALLQGETFKEARRSPSFSFRSAEPGTYTLILEMSDPANSRLERTTINLVVTDQPARPALGSTGASLGILPTPQPVDPLYTEPPIVGSRITMLGSRILTLLPNRTVIQSFDVDPDVEKDENGNGIPTDDYITTGTLARTELHPLRLLLPDGDRNMAFTVVDTAGAVRSRTVQVTSSTSIPAPTGALAIQADIQPDGTVQFRTSPSTANGSAVVTEWDFGDGSTSLQETPSHTYVAPGTYTVHVQTRLLATGRIMAQATQELTISNVGPAQGSGAVVIADPNAQGQKSPGILSRIWGVVRVTGIILLVIALLGALVYAVARLLRRRGGGTLAERLERMESKIVETKDAPAAPVPSAAPSVDQTPAPLQIRRPDAIDVTAGRTTAEATPKTQSPAIQEPPPIVDPKNAPEWLKKGMDTQAKPSQPAAAPAAPKPAPAPTPAPQPPKPVAPAPTPAPAPQAPRPTPAAPAPAPSPTSAPQAPSSAPAPRPTPVAPPTPKPTPVAPPTPAPVSPAPTTPAPAAAPQAPKPAPAPAPATPAPALATVPSTPAPQPAPVAAPQPVKPVAPTPIPTPVPVVPAPSPQPAVAPATPIAPAAPVQPSAPVAPQPAPAPVAPTPATPPAAPAPTPTPAPAPAAAATVTPPAAPSKPLTPEEERERERKRRKRQRYRENKRLREEAAAAGKPMPPGTEPEPGDEEFETEGDDAPATAAAPTPAATPPVVTINQPTIVKPAQSAPAPQPAAPKPAPAPAAPAPNADGNVAFVIRADSVVPQQNTPPTPPAPGPNPAA